MSTLEEIRKRKLSSLQQLQQRAQEQSDSEQNIREQVGALEDFVRSHLSKEALARYGNLKIAHPEKAIKALAIIAQVIEQKQITQISDEQFKELLQLIDAGKRQTKITF